MPPRLDRHLPWRLGHGLRRLGEVLARRMLRLILCLGLCRVCPRGPMIWLQLWVVSADGGFDAAEYLETNRDVRASGMDPLRHYLRYGLSEGRNPSAVFDEVRYRRQAGLAPRDRISGLAHFLVLGRALGLGPQTRRRNDSSDAAAIRAALARLASISPRSGAGASEPPVDVIVPVYGGRAETLRCLASVLEARNRTEFLLVVVDDHGPDPKLRADLAELAKRGLIELLVPRRNLGFVRAVNLAMQRAEGSGRDVVWLNADTEVFGDWIDRLRRAAYSAANVATVTPMTNNGTICSYPRFNKDNPDPLELDWPQLDRLAARVNWGRTADLPTCVGFATYVRRAAIQDVGPLDARAFGRGYGEENDFSQRALRAGWRNLAAGDVFVRHIGQCSFGAERARRVDQAMRVMARRYPNYARDVAEFISADPMAPLRRALDLARLKRLASGRRRALLITHSLGGGTAQHVDEEIARLSRGDAGVVLMRGGAGGPGTVRLGHPGAGALPGLEAIPIGGAELVSVLGRLGITGIRLHHLADFGRDGAERMAWLIDALDLPLEVTVHDYLAICPRINLTDKSGMYCGEPGPPGAERACQACLMRRRSRFGAPDIREWRQVHERLLTMARIVKVPNGDVAARLGRYFPRLRNVVVRPHDRLGAIAPRSRQRRPGPLRVAAIGAIGPIKGFDVLLRLARAAPEGEMHLSVIGHTRSDRAAAAAGIAVTGRYRNDALQGLIETADPDLILIPSIWPETYCYALSHALASARPVAGFGIGAVGTRLERAAASGHPATVLPLHMAHDPQALCAALRQAAGFGLESAGQAAVADTVRAKSA